MSAPSAVQVRAAVETLANAGFRLAGPAAERLRLLNAAAVADLCQVSDDRARAIIRELPGSVMLPGGDLRCRMVALEAWLDARPVTLTRAA